MEMHVGVWFGANTVHAFKNHIMLKSCLALGLIMIATCIPINCKGETFPCTGLRLFYYATVKLGSKHTVSPPDCFWAWFRICYASGTTGSFHTAILVCRLRKPSNINMGSYVPLGLWTKDHSSTDLDESWCPTVAMHVSPWGFGVGFFYNDH